MAKKIKITKEQKEIIENYLLSEAGALDWAKNKLANLMGRYKVRGVSRFSWGGSEKIRKMDQEAGARIQQILDKQGNELIKNLDAKIKSENPDFPNTKDQQTFLKTVLEIGAVYDSIVAATQKKPNEEGYMLPDLANAIISDLREYVDKYMNVDLKTVYTTVNESINQELTEEQLKELDEYFGLNEQELSADDVRQSARDRREKAGGGEDFNNQKMQDLKSNRLPLTLAGVGASLGAFSWLVNTEWFKSLFEEIVKTPKIEYVKELVETKSSVIASIKPGEGMTQILNRLMKLNLNPNSSPTEFVNAVKELGGGNLQAGIEALCAKGGIFPKPSDAYSALEAIAKNPNAFGNTLGEMFQGQLAGTGKQVGDLLVTQTGGSLQGLIVNSIVKMVPKLVMTTTTKIGAGYAIAKGLGAILGPVGIGLVAAGVTVKLLRMKGQKSSRLATLDALYQSLRDIKGAILPSNNGDDKQGDDKQGDGKQGDGKQGDGNTTNGLYNDLKSLFQFIVNNKGTLGTGANSPSKSQSQTARQNLGGRNYQGGQIMKGGNRAQAGGQTQSGRERFFANQNYVRENEELVSEGKFFKDKQLIKFLNSKLRPDQLQKFEQLLTRIEYVRNTLRKGLAKTDDDVIKKFLNELDSNPIMSTDFTKLTSVNINDPQDVNTLVTFIKETLNTVYSSDFKFDNMVGKMKTLGGGNINKLEEVDANYSASNPNKSFTKDSQSRTTFKKNLAKFLKTLIGLFQYLHKLMTQGNKQQKQQPQQQSNQQQIFENAPESFNLLIERKKEVKGNVLESEINRMKSLMKY